MSYLQWCHLVECHEVLLPHQWFYCQNQHKNQLGEIVAPKADLLGVHLCSMNHYLDNGLFLWSAFEQQGLNHQWQTHNIHAVHWDHCTPYHDIEHGDQNEHNSSLWY